MKLLIPHNQLTGYTAYNLYTPCHVTIILDDNYDRKGYAAETSS